MTTTIGEAARRAGCAASTIRYYERVGLIAPARRSDNGYRDYDDAAIARLAFVQRARALGFTLAGVADLLRLSDHPDAPCDSVDRLLVERRAEIRTRIERLAALDDELARLERACAGGHRIEECGILAALSDGAA